MKYLKAYEDVIIPLNSTYMMQKLDNFSDLFLTASDLGQYFDKIKIDTELITSNSSRNANILYRLYKTKNGKYIFTYTTRGIEEIALSPNVYIGFKKIIKEIQTYDFQKKYLKKDKKNIEVLKDFGIHPKIKEEFPALTRGSEWGFFDLEGGFV